MGTSSHRSVEGTSKQMSLLPILLLLFLSIHLGATENKTDGGAFKCYFCETDKKCTKGQDGEEKECTQKACAKNLMGDDVTYTCGLESDEEGCHEVDDAVAAIAGALGGEAAKIERCTCKDKPLCNASPDIKPSSVIAIIFAALSMYYA